MAEAITTSWHEAGRAEGRTEGRTEHARETLLRLLNRRFGPLPRELESGVRSIQDEARLDALADRLVAGATLEELGLQV